MHQHHRTIFLRHPYKVLPISYDDGESTTTRRAAGSDLSGSMRRSQRILLSLVPGETCGYRCFSRAPTPTRAYRLLGDGPFHKPDILVGERKGRAAGRSRRGARLCGRPLSLVRWESSTARHGHAYSGMSKLAVVLSVRLQRGSPDRSTHLENKTHAIIRSNVSTV